MCNQSVDPGRSSPLILGKQLLELMPQTESCGFPVRWMSLANVRMRDVAVIRRVVAAESSVVIAFQRLYFCETRLNQHDECTAHLRRGAVGDLGSKRLTCCEIKPSDRHAARARLVERGRLDDSVRLVPELRGEYDADHRLVITHRAWRARGAAVLFADAFWMRCLKPAATIVPWFRLEYRERSHAATGALSRKPMMPRRVAITAKSPGIKSSKWTGLLPGASANMKQAPASSNPISAYAGPSIQ